MIPVADRPARHRLWAFLVGGPAGVASAAIFLYLLFGHRVIRAAYDRRSIEALHGLIEPTRSRPLASYLHRADHNVLLAALILFGVLGLAHLLLAGQLDDRRPASRLQRAISLAAYPYCLYLVYHVLVHISYEGTAWYSLDRVLHLTEAPPFQHRILFVWAAWLFQAVHPGLTVFGAYLLTQMLGATLALFAIKRWAGLFVERRVAFVSQFIMTFMLLPTLKYYTFYDIGVVFFYALCLLLLFRGHRTAYLAAFAVGTINHEVTLLLVPVYVALSFDRERGRAILGFCALQLLTYAAVRAGLFHWLPTSRAWWSKLDENLFMIFRQPVVVLRTVASPILWYSLAALALKNAPVGLKRCLVLLPMLIAIAVVVGHVNESRLLNAFIPVAVALVTRLYASGVRRVGTELAAGPGSGPSVG